MNEQQLKDLIKKDLGLKNIKESYVTKAQKYDINTDLLSAKSIEAHQQILQQHVEDLNTISAKLDAASRDDTSLNNSDFRSLKIDEVYNLNSAYLHAMFFENIGDPKSVVTMDSMAFMRIERDFGSFDDWQKDFIACAMASRDGWAVLVYNNYLGRYMNVVIDSHNNNIPLGSSIVLVLDCQEHAYSRDYLADRKTYIYAMMKELDWNLVEERIKKCEKVAKVFGRS